MLEFNPSVIFVRNVFDALYANTGMIFFEGKSDIFSRQWTTGVLRNYALRGYLIDRKHMGNDRILIIQLETIAPKAFYYAIA